MDSMPKMIRCTESNENLSSRLKQRIEKSASCRMSTKPFMLGE